jgi:hypothetical protein
VTEVLDRAAWRAGERTVVVAKTAALLALLLAVSLFLRTRALDAGYWTDEGLSVGIASFPLSEIPGVLRQDGSPPLYYVLLHFWLDWFGAGEEATHAFSLLFALLAIPAALWAGWSLFGRRAGWVAATLAALNPFLTVYAQETRMYSLVILLSLVVTAAFLHAFAFRRRRYLPLFAASAALLLYTHNWAIFLLVGSLAGLVAIERLAGGRRELLRDAALAYGAALLAYLPWLPTLVYQAQNTGAPWSKAPSPLELVGGFAIVLAGQGALVAVLLAGGIGLKTLLADGPSPVRTAVLAAVALGLATLAAGWVFSQLTPAWANRYLGVLIGPTILVAAAVLPRAGRLGAVALVLVVLFWLPFSASENKSNPDRLAELFAATIEPGDVVLSTHPEQVPVLAHYFGRDHRYATPLGPVEETRVMDWRHALERLEAASPETTLEPIVAGLEPGERIVLVHPVFRDEGQWSARWTRLVRVRSEEWSAALAADPRLTRTREYAPPYTDASRQTLALEFFERVPTG